MPKITINDEDHIVEAGLTVLQACEQAGVEIPRFCYHERLSIAGNCRMCLVEVSPGPPKPQASCALPVMDGQVIKTNSPMVEKARKGVMEFLLINHPLDCPICDQGGECDLQDQAVAYGSNISRYKEAKRAVEDKYMGPLVKTIMTRCIHCTRCVRFVSEVAGVDAIGLLNRGTSAEISALEQAVDSELSGNVVDLCPVGALTSKPYSYHARSWELKHTQAIDVSDGLGANIRLDSRGNEILRVLPRLNEDVNEEWISDKARHSCDGLKRQRLDKPYIRNQKGRLEASDWKTAFDVIAKKVKGLKPQEIGAVAGDYCDIESLYALKSLMMNLGVSNMDCRQHGQKIPADAPRSAYLFNSTVRGIEDMDALLIIGSDIRKESPVLNARIRKRYLSGQLKIARIGAPTDLTYEVEELGNAPSVLNDLLQEKGQFANVLKEAKHPAVIIGEGAIARNDGEAVLANIHKLVDHYALVQEDWNGMNFLSPHAGLVGALDIGFLPQKKVKALKSDGLGLDEMKAQAGKGIKMLYMMGADEMDMDGLEDVFIIYQGHHGDKGAHHADVILPGAAYSEKEASYVNLEGRVQLSLRAIFPPGEAKQDWAIIRALSDYINGGLKFNDLSELRSLIYEDYPHLAAIDQIAPAIWQSVLSDAAMTADGFEYAVKNFYMTNAICRASETMAQCVKELIHKENHASEKTLEVANG